MTAGEKLINALYSGYNKLLTHRTELDMMNVFPVADSDTGSNMTRTMKAGVEAIKGEKDKTCPELLEKCSKAMLRNARGNSGVILSVLFKGFSDSIKKSGTISVSALEPAFDNALSSASAALSNPVFKGTILSVVIAVRDACSQFHPNEEFETAWQTITSEAKKALDSTKYNLDALREADVSDSGANGLFLIIKAVNEVVSGKPESDDTALRQTVFRKAAKAAAADYTYCTEFIINRSNAFPISSLEKDFEKIGGSIAIVPDGRIVKVHLHTNVPNHALGFALRFGALTDIKIDNMVFEGASKSEQQTDL